MTTQDMLDELSDFGFQDTSIARKLNFLNDAYYDLCGRHPWPFLEGEVSVSLVAGIDTIPMPSDWAQTLEITLYTGGTSGGVVLQPDRLENIQEESPDTQTGVPRNYYFVGSQIYLFPSPDSSSYTVDHVYLKTPTKMVQGTGEGAILLPPRYHRVIIEGALAKLYRMEDDPVSASDNQNIFEQRIQAMVGDLMRRQYQRSDYIRVLGEEGYDSFPFGYPM